MKALAFSRWLKPLPSLAKRGYRGHGHEVTDQEQNLHTYIEVVICLSFWPTSTER